MTVGVLTSPTTSTRDAVVAAVVVSLGGHLAMGHWYTSLPRVTSGSCDTAMTCTFGGAKEKNRFLSASGLVAN
jgi:hypothetical protein